MCVQIEAQDLKPLTFASQRHGDCHILMPLYGEGHLFPPISLQLLAKLHLHLYPGSVCSRRDMHCNATSTYVCSGASTLTSRRAQGRHGLR